MEHYEITRATARILFDIMTKEMKNADFDNGEEYGMAQRSFR